MSADNEFINKAKQAAVEIPDDGNSNFEKVKTPESISSNEFAQNNQSQVENFDDAQLEDAKLLVHSDESESHVDVPEHVPVELTNEEKESNLLGWLNGEIPIKGDMAAAMDTVDEFSQS